MKIYKTQEEVNADITHGVLVIKGDVRFECDISIGASIVVTKGDLNCLNLNCFDLTCRNLDCWNLTCFNLTCRDLTYYALCFAYQSIKCTSYKTRREVHQKPICLDGEITIVKKEDDATKEAIKLLESNGYTISK